jgi:hypothetical protein
MNISGLQTDATRGLFNQVIPPTTRLSLSGSNRLLQAYSSETDPIFTAWDKSTGIIITETQIVPGIVFPVTLAGHETLTNKTITSPLGLVKSDVGLSNVDNTSDLSKPLSTAMTNALALKEVLTNKSTNIIADGASDIKYPSVKAVKTYVDANVLTIVDHNDTLSKQGGTATEYYHLTNAQHTIATQSANSFRSGYLTASDWIAFNAAGGGGTPNSLITTNFSISEVGGKLVIKYTPTNTVIFSFSSAGLETGLSDLVAFGTP